MKRTSLKIIDEQYTPSADYFTVLAISRRAKSVRRPFIVAAAYREDPNELENVQRFSNIRKARAHFNDVAKGEHLSELSQGDWQVNHIYRWEDDYLVPHTSLVKRPEALKLLQKIADDYSVSCPNFVWTRRKDPSQPDYSVYDDETDTIHFMHRNRVTLLHEMAHALVYKRYEDAEELDNHGPTFLWQAIELYHHYEGFDLPYLISTAQKEGLLDFSNPIVRDGYAAGAPKMAPTPI